MKITKLLVFVALLVVNSSAYAGVTHALTCAMSANNTCTPLMSVGPATTIASVAYSSADFTAEASLVDSADQTNSILTISLFEPVTNNLKSRAVYNIPSAASNGSFSLAGQTQAELGGVTYTLVCAGSNYADGASGSIDLCPASTR